MSKNIFFFAILFITYGCAQFTPFHTARTEGKGNLTLSPSISGVGLSEQSGAGELGSLFLPYGQLEAAYGLNDNLDVVASFSTSANLLASLKYRIIGTNESGFAFTIMPGYEYQTSIPNNTTRVDRFHIPLIFSIHTDDNIGIFLSPKYVIQVADNVENFSFPGIAAGISIDRRVQYIFGGGVYFPFTSEVGIQGSIYQIGASARIPLFRN